MIALMRRTWPLLARGGCLGMVCLFAGSACAGELPLKCGDLANHYGPFDYRSDKSKLPVVEQAHFDSGIETLTRGKSAHIGGDIDYTLRAFPNHHRALLAMIRLAEREKISVPKGARYSDECYLLRAEHFRPDDGVVKMLMGIYLMKKGRNKEAVERLEAAEKLDSNDANLQYNLGLVYFRLGRYEESLAGAHRAYASGFGLPGLKSMLKRVGKWREPVSGVDGPKEKSYPEEALQTEEPAQSVHQ